MNSLLLIAVLTPGLSSNLPPQAPLVSALSVGEAPVVMKQYPCQPQAPEVTYTRHVCPCGPGCACPSCDCPDTPIMPAIKRATLVSSPVIYPHQMTPMPAFRPTMPAPMYYTGGFSSGGFGNMGSFGIPMTSGGGSVCGPGGCR